MIEQVFGIATERNDALVMVEVLVERDEDGKMVEVNVYERD